MPRRPADELTALREENALLLEEVRVSRAASDITAKLVVEQFERMDALLRTIEDKAAEEGRQRAYLAALQETTVGLLSRLDVDAVLEVLMGRLGDFARTRHVFLFEVVPGEDLLRCTRGLGLFDALLGQTLERGAGLSGRVWASGRPLLVDDYDAWQGRSCSWTLGLYRAAIAAPLRTGGEVVGVLGAAHERDSELRFDATSVRDLMRFAELASVALDNARLYAEAERSRRTAEDAARAKSDFLASMSHEIRTPMNAIIGMADLARRQEVSPRLRGQLDVIRSSGLALLDMLDTVLDYARIEAGKLALDRGPFSLWDVLGRVGDLFGAQAFTRGLELVVSADGDVPNALVGDEHRLGQVLVNLVSNAVKFTPSGEVVLRAQLLKRAAKELRVRFSVQDSGIGMSAEQVAHVFDAFYQVGGATRRAQGGAGLGLAICQNIVTAMGGHFHVHSEPGGGTAFWVDVSLQAGEDEHAPQRAPMDLQGARALVVDDNVAARDVACALLADLGLRPEGVADCRAATLVARQAAAAGAPFTVALLDDGGVDHGGCDAADQIRRALRGPRSKLLLATPFADDHVAQRAERAGVDAVLAKPLRPAAVRAALLDHPDAQREGAAAHASWSGSELRVLRHPALDGARVLLVDDNAINREVSSAQLERLGVNVELAVSGREALQRLSGPHRYDAVLMDVQMPDIDGLDATRRLRSDPRHASLPIIAMTAETGPDRRERVLAAGMDDHLSKPVEERRLVAVLARHIGRGRSANGSGSADQPPRRPEPLDERSALRRLGGDERLLRDLLARFVVENAGDVEATRRAIEAEDGGTAERLLHGLRGVAATLGARPLTRAAEEAEVAVRGQRWEDAALATLALQAEMERLTSSVRAAESESVEPQAFRTAWPFVPTPRLRSLFRRLLASLQCHDLEAGDIAEELAERLRGTLAADDAACVLRSARALDYAGAALRLELVAREQGLAPTEGVLSTGGGRRADRQAVHDEGVASERATVLVVDDVATNVRLLGAALRHDYRVLFALDGQEALRLASGPLRPDLVLLDVDMPGMDGNEVCRRLKSAAATQDIPVVFVTGRADDADVTTGLALGAVDYITRPLSLPVVRARVRNHIELKRHRDALATLSSQDGLTGLPNRRHFDETLAREWDRARRDGASIAVLMVDIDHFKAFNDTYGHPAGDECLRRVAAALRDAVRHGSDLAARYGGEEFAAVLPAADPQAAVAVAERMREAVAELAIGHERSVTGATVSVSVGVAVDLPSATLAASALVERADRALYRAKSAGRDRVMLEDTTLKVVRSG